MEFSLFMLVLGFALHCLGVGIGYYLLKLYLDFHSERKRRRKKEPEYVREINRRLRFNKVETERDLI